MRILTGKEANDFLAGLGVDAAYCVLVKSLEEARKKLGGFSFPLVLKTISKNVIHKTEIGGVKIAKNREEFTKKFNELLEDAKKHKIKPDHIMMQEYVDGVELIIGLKKDQTFGHVIMLGFGGIYVEAVRDVTFRVCPINDRDASKMIEDLKSRDILLDGRRNFDLEKLRKTLMKISKIPQKKKGLLELDVNPIMIQEDKLKAVDVRVILE